jgi:lipopolysaccharide export system protein LptA
MPVAWPGDEAAAQSRSTRTKQQQPSNSSSVPNALQGFSKNRDKPIEIEATSLEVQDKTKMATFRGKVQVKQGDTELRCNTLVVHYEQEGGTTSGSRGAVSASDRQRIRLLEATGNVVVTQRDQVATGESGLFDMRKNEITLRGNVVVSQGQNVLRGDRLIVDMTTAVSRVESDKGRVQGLFQPSTKDEPQKDRGERSIMPRLR